MSSGRQLKRWLIGDPLATAQAAQERLSKIKALAVFASDALSSTAYATEEILIVLTAVSLGLTVYSVPVALAIAALIFIVSFSYAQTIRVYPQGGGSYTVASENLGTTYGLIAGASLLIDYVLTAAVSVSAGIAAFTSAVPALYEHRVILAIFFLIVITIINLRGVQESGTVFAVPTYLFVFSIVILVIVGTFKVLTGTLVAQTPIVTEGVPAVSAFILLRAFSSGCSALTGVEAVSNGVPAFRPPESENAVKTLRWMAFILAVLFIGVTYLSFAARIVPTETETVISQIARTIFGTGPMYFIIQFATMFILLIATNTSFAGFPRLASVMAKDKFFPRQFALIGDWLVYTNGIIFLASITSIVVIIFQGSTHSLIPLYAVGVFLSFTLSQAGMVMRWLRTPGNHLHNIIINATGAVTTGIVLVIVLTTKFIHGAWVVAVLIPILVYIFSVIHAHYTRLDRELVLDAEATADSYKPFTQLVVVPVAGINKSVVNSIRYAKTISENVVAVHIETNESSSERTKQSWQKMGWDIPLEIIPSPYRTLFNPLFTFLHEKRKEMTELDPESQIVVVVPEFVYYKWWEYLLHSETAVLLKFLLRFEPNIVVCSVPYQIAQPKVQLRHQL
jgi:amino acid transporter